MKLPGAETDALQVARGPCLSAAPQVAVTVQLQDAARAQSLRNQWKSFRCLQGLGPWQPLGALTCRCLELEVGSCIFIRWDGEAAV